MNIPWITALKVFNAEHPDLRWITPARNTKNYQEVRHLMEGQNPEVRRGKAIAELRKVEAETTARNAVRAREGAVAKLRKATAHMKPGVREESNDDKAMLIKRMEAGRDKAFQLADSGMESRSKIYEESGLYDIAPYVRDMSKEYKEKYDFVNDWLYHNVQYKLDVRMSEYRRKNEITGVDEFAKKMGPLPKTREKAWIVKDRKDFVRALMATGMSSDSARKTANSLRYGAPYGIGLYRPKTKLMIIELKSDFEKDMDVLHKAMEKEIRENLKHT